MDVSDNHIYSNIIYSLLVTPPLNLAVLEFSSTEYAATEGRDAPAACIILASLLSDFIGTATVAIMTEGSVQFRDSAPATLNLTTADVGRRIYCITPLLEVDFVDTVVQGNRVSNLTAIAIPMLSTVERITFTPGRDQAVYVVFDDDGMQNCYYLPLNFSHRLICNQK